MSGSSDELLPRSHEGSLDRYREAVAGKTTNTLGPGSKVGNYTIERLLASGGMGDVYLAHCTHRSTNAAATTTPKATISKTAVSQTAVALKLARTDQGNPAVLARRLRNETQALQSIQHKGIVRFVDSGDVDGVFFLATEFVSGLDLLDWARSRQPDAFHILRVAEELADALAACHSNHLLHRDLSPSNVIIDVDGHPVLVDFGLGVDLDHGQLYSELTKTGHVAGKYAYLPPEARDHGCVDERWDIYAFGACLYAMLARQEFEPRQLHELYPSLRTCGDTFTRKLELIARKCLAKNPEHRFQTADSLKRALHNALNPAPKWQASLLAGTAVALITGLFSLTQWAGSPTDANTPIRFWSHGLHLGLCSLFLLRAEWTRRHGLHRLELSRFMPWVWLLFGGYYAFNMILAGHQTLPIWAPVVDAAISNATGVALLLAFCALWIPTHVSRNKTYRWARTGIFCTWPTLLALSIWGMTPADTIDRQAQILRWVQLPSSLFVGVSLCCLALGLGQKTLRVPILSLIVLLLYGLVQLLYPAFAWIASQSTGWLISIYGVAMIGKLGLFLGIESTLRSWSLFGYEGQLSDEW